MAEATVDRDSAATSHILPAEREKASFDAAALEEIIAGKRPARIQSFTDLFDGAEFDASMDDFESYPDLFAKQLGRAAKAMKIIKDNPSLMIAHQAQKVAMGDFFDTGAMGIHFIAYLPFLRTQANDEQKKLWLDGAVNAEYFGAYAQTELGHGSNVRGLETTATFDKATDEFVIDSPTLTSMKWWPTGMYASTHGVVFAQLIIDGTNYGVFGFFMQFRDEHGDLMPGVEIGEIGPKIAQGHCNIGYGRFDHVRVPRFNMFSKHAQVTKDGEFIAPPPKLSKFKYVGMMNIRVGMIGGASNAAAKAATIAIRYACVRMQGFKATQAENALASGEHAIIDYNFQQYRLFKCLGGAYLMLWTGRSINDFLNRVVDGIGQGDESMADELPELHATCAGLKAYCTTWTGGLVEDSRRCCGGQGFLRSSGIADMSSNYVEQITAEGEVVVLALQNARFLIKTVGQIGRGEAVCESAQYLAAEPMKPINLQSYENQTSTLVDLLRDRARNVAHDLAEDFTKAESSGMSFDEALNSVAVLAWHACAAHCQYSMARNAFAALEKMVPDPAAKQALMNLLDLVLLQYIWEDGRDFMGVLDRQQMRLVYAEITRLLKAIRPDAVALCDAFGFTDHHLKSTIGRYDGNVYEAIYEEAKRSPLNGKKMVGWDALKPMLDMDFIRQEGAKQRWVPKSRV